MSTNISTVLSSIINQQVPALVQILERADEFAKETDTPQEQLLEARLVADMNPLSWQIQATLELLVRGVARLTEQELPSVVVDEANFADLIARVKQIQTELAPLDSDSLDASTDKHFEIPIGPGTHITLTGQDYLLKFLLPNIYFHLTTTYALLRQSGVPLGKRDFMGPINV